MSTVQTPPKNRCGPFQKQLFKLRFIDTASALVAKVSEGVKVPWPVGAITAGIPAGSQVGILPKQHVSEAPLRERGTLPRRRTKTQPKAEEKSHSVAG